MQFHQMGALLLLGWAVALPVRAQQDSNRTVATAGSGGFSLTSGDGNHTVRFRGYVQADARFYGSDDVAGVDNFAMRRVRPVLEATIYKLYDFRIMPDFGGPATALLDAWFEARLHPRLTVRAGKFKPAVGLERLQSATDLKFAERGLPTNLAPQRDIGVQLAGSLVSGIVGWSAAVFNGVPDLANGDPELSDRKDFVGRVLITPFARQHLAAPADMAFGVAVSSGKEEGSANGATGLPSYRSPGQLTVFRYRTSSSNPGAGTVFADGDRIRIAPQGYLNAGPLGLLAEYTIARHAVSRDAGAAKTSAKLQHTAWQLIGSRFLTGERNSFRSVAPRKHLNPSAHSWGAVEVVARYGELDIDDDAFSGDRYADSRTSVSSATSWGVGLNWHAAGSVRVGLNYEKTRFTGGAITGSRRAEEFIVTRFQTAF